jgi:thioredoxin-related protein
MFMKIKTFIIFFLLSLIIPFLSLARDLPIRGQPKGESKIKVGDKAPLITPDLEKAHNEGKVIALMLGYQTHCPWCDRMDRYIRHVMEETKDFNNRFAFSRWQIEHAKMIAPPDEGIELKKAYGVEGQPWLFLIDKEGTVRYIYKQFISGDKFERLIYEILGEKKDVPVFDKE